MIKTTSNFNDESIFGKSTHPVILHSAVIYKALAIIWPEIWANLLLYSFNKSLIQRNGVFYTKK